METPLQWIALGLISGTLMTVFILHCNRASRVYRCQWGCGAEVPTPGPCPVCLKDRYDAERKIVDSRRNFRNQRN